MIRKSGHRFSEKIMLNQTDENHDAIPSNRIMIWCRIGAISFAGKPARKSARKSIKQMPGESP
jgi:hypothetical protein